MNKSTYINLGIALFFLVVAVDSLGIFLDEETLRYIFKPLIFPTLAMVYIFSVSKKNKLYLTALFFSFLGDIFLLNHSNLFFMFGLTSFLIMHLIYILIVNQDIRSYKIRNVIVTSIPFILVLVFTIFFVYRNLSEFFIPIIIYGIVVSVLGTISFYNYLEKRSGTASILLLGIFFFITSNAMSAIEKFNLQNRELAIGIMLTYAIAQFLIYKYMVKRSKIT